MKQGLPAAATTLLGLILFVTLAAYWFSIPWRTFDRTIEPAPKMIQVGTINEVWITNEDGRRTYVHVNFANGTHRKCTIGGVGLYHSTGPEALIGKLNCGYRSWDFIALDIGLPSDSYWQLRRAGWPMFTTPREIRLELRQ
jgi:hypothetical protein